MKRTRFSKFGTMLVVTSFLAACSSQNPEQIYIVVTATTHAKWITAKPISTLSPNLATLGVKPTAVPTEQFLGINARIVDRDNNQITVTGFKAEVQSSCGGMVYYIGVPRETNLTWDFLRINTGAYEVDLPLEIIRRISVREEQEPMKNNPGKTYTAYYYDVDLADNTSISGELESISHFSGSTDLGSTEINPRQIREITPLDEPKTTYTAYSEGMNQAELYLVSGETLTIDQATLFTVNKNKNGCYLGEKGEARVKFTAGGFEYELDWAKIDTIVFLKPETSEPNQPKIRLVGTGGSEYDGSMEASTGIEGLAKIGSYVLTVRVSFSSSDADKLVFGH